MSNKYTILNFSKPQQWLIGLAITVGFFGANFSDGILLYSRPIEDFTKSLLVLSGAARIFGTGLLASIYGAIAYLGIRDIRQNGINKKNTVTTALGLLSCVAMLLLQMYSFAVTRDFNNYVVNAQTEIISEIKTKLQSDLTPERLSKVGLAYAETMYEFDGSILEYKMPDGKLTKYEPNVEAQKNRHLVMMLTVIRDRESSMKTTVFFLWILAPIAATTLGLFYPTNRPTR